MTRSVPPYHLVLITSILINSILAANNLTKMTTQHPTESPTKATCTTFLTLPRELRQAILYESYNYKGAQLYIRQACTFWHYARTRLSIKLESIIGLAEVLNAVHPMIGGDVDFVVKKWEQGLAHHLQRHVRQLLHRRNLPRYLPRIPTSRR